MIMTERKSVFKTTIVYTVCIAAISLVLEVLLGCYMYSVLKADFHQAFLKEVTNGASRDELQQILKDPEFADYLDTNTRDQKKLEPSELYAEFFGYNPSKYLQEFCEATVVYCPDQSSTRTGRFTRSISGNVVNVYDYRNKGRAAGSPKNIIYVTNDGKPGPPGIRGEKGDKGLFGLMGPNGYRGEQGPQGKRGEDGYPGPIGPNGRKGNQGDTGDEGEKGDQGPLGEPGSPGPIGVKGAQGSAGEKGDTGATGAEGPYTTGLPGSPGPKGDRGYPGIPMPDGEPGVPGTKGDQGEPGLPGGIDTLEVNVVP